MTPEAYHVANQIFKIVQEVYGSHVKPGMQFNVTPEIAQELVKAFQLSNAFLKKVTMKGKREKVGKIVTMDATGSLSKSTGTDQGAPYHYRRPSNPIGLSEREYRLHENESDALIDWDTIDEWAGEAEFYPLFRELLVQVRAADLLRKAWNGQFRASHTDPVTFPLLQDNQSGWIQYMIDVAPEQVLGITPNAASPNGYDIDPIHVGEGAGDNGFESLDQLVHLMEQQMFHEYFRNKPLSTRAIVGSNLILNETGGLIGDTQTPSERLALQTILKNHEIGGFKPERSNEFPANGLVLTDPKNLHYYYQKTSVRRSLKQSDEMKGIVDYHYCNEGFVIGHIEGCAVAHPDALLFKNASGDWVPLSDVTWKKAA